MYTLSRHCDIAPTRLIYSLLFCDHMTLILARFYPRHGETFVSSSMASSFFPMPLAARDHSVLSHLFFGLTHLKDRCSSYGIEAGTCRVGKDAGDGLAMP